MASEDSGMALDDACFQGLVCANGWDKGAGLERCEKCLAWCMCMLPRTPMEALHKAIKSRGCIASAPLVSPLRPNVEV